MSFLGMGPLEILIVLLIAFIFLGPERLVDAARVLGKWTGEARRLASELPRLDMEEDDKQLSNPPAAQRSGGPDSQTDAPVAHPRVTRASPDAIGDPDSSGPAQEKQP